MDVELIVVIRGDVPDGVVFDVAKIIGLTPNRHYPFCRNTDVVFFTTEEELPRIQATLNDVDCVVGYCIHPHK